MSHRQAILDGIATILWGHAWADHAEEHRCCNLSGCEITDHMPPIPDMVRTCAATIAASIEKASHASLDELYARSELACDTHPSNEAGGARCHVAPRDTHTPERFGECLAYASMGAGVSWDDDHTEVPGLIVPYSDTESCDVRIHADDTCGVQTDTPRCASCLGWYDRPWRDGDKNKCPHCGAVIRAKRLSGSKR